MGYNDLFIESDLSVPLSKEEIYEYFVKYNDGDMDARNVIIETNIRLVIYEVMTKFYNTPYDKNELISVGLIGLIKGVDNYDTSRGILFSTYALRCIDNEILMFLRRSNKHVGVSSLDSIIINDNSEDSLSILDFLYDDKIDLVLDYEKKELYLKIRKLVDMLPDKKKKIINLYFGFDGNLPITQKEISEKLNIAQPTVSKTVSEVLKKISGQLSREGLIQNKDVKVRKRK